MDPNDPRLIDLRAKLSTLWWAMDDPFEDVLHRLTLAEAALQPLPPGAAARIAPRALPAPKARPKDIAA